MENSVEISAKTVQEAVELALAKLDTDEDNVNIEVIDEGNKGIFGLIGSKMAKVKVTLRGEAASDYVFKEDVARQFLSGIFEKMGIDAQLDIYETAEDLDINVSSDNIGIIIGRRGETLDALQLLTSLVVNKNKDTYKKVTLDVENYRQKREESLVRLSNRMADKVIKYKKSVTLECMNSYERKVIHMSLQDNEYVETYSVGNEPNRKVVITLKK